MPENPKPPGVETTSLMALVSDWRREPSRVLDCPVCQAAGLSIVDKSARPYSEWYAFDCPTCGWQHNMHIPMAGPPPGS